MNIILRWLTLFVATALALAACGSDSDSASDDGGGAGSTEDTDEAEAPEDEDEAMAEDEDEAMAEDEDEAMAEDEDEAMAEDEDEAMAEDEDEAMAEDEDEAMAEDDAEGSAGTEVGVSLVEWAVEAPTELEAGALSFAVTNDSGLGIAHRFGIARGESYESLPLLGNGAIDEEALGDDFLGDTGNFQAGESATLDIDLEAGDYVLFCNISNGPSSHAAQGQTLSVTVS